jgi:hypothetical protein
MLYPLLEKIWNEEKIPEDWEEGLIMKIPKKGNFSNCNRRRGVTLPSIANNSSDLDHFKYNTKYSGKTPPKRFCDMEEKRKRLKWRKNSFVCILT